LRAFWALLALLLVLCSEAGASQKKVYSGSEAAALRCVNAVAFTAIALEGAGRIGEPEKEVMLGISVLILERHVSGTWAQKKAALAVVRDRRDIIETLDDFENLAKKCLKQFPIN
jgi:voltage-gated potassium channel Kch